LKGKDSSFLLSEEISERHQNQKRHIRATFRSRPPGRKNLETGKFSRGVRLTIALSIRKTDPNSGHSIRERNILREGNPKTRLNRRYLPQDPEDYLFTPRAHRNIFPPSSRTRKRRETTSQMIHLGGSGSSSIIFLVLTFLCVLGFILFTQKALVGAINMRDSESNEVKRVVASSRPAVEYFGEE